MTKHISENSGVYVRAGAVAAAVISLGVWFNSRLSAVETSVTETKKDIVYTQKNVDEMRQDIKEVLRLLRPAP